MLLCLLLATTTRAGAGQCHTVELKGQTSYQPQFDKMGEYTLQSNSTMNGGKRVYKMRNNWLYYFPAKGGWVVGPSVGSSDFTMFIKSTEDAPLSPSGDKSAWHVKVTKVSA